MSSFFALYERKGMGEGSVIVYLSYIVGCWKVGNKERGIWNRE